jgi:hypothetical protein
METYEGITHQHIGDVTLAHAARTEPNGLIVGCYRNADIADAWAVEVVGVRDGHTTEGTTMSVAEAEQFIAQLTAAVQFTRQYDRTARTAGLN